MLYHYHLAAHKFSSFSDFVVVATVRPCHAALARCLGVPQSFAWCHENTTYGVMDEQWPANTALQLHFLHEMRVCANRTVDTMFVQYPADVDADIRSHNADIAAAIVMPIIATLLCGLLCYLWQQVSCCKQEYGPV